MIIEMRCVHEFSGTTKKARINRGYTQQQIADLMGITNSTYCGYETGKRQPDVAKIKQLAEILNTSGDELLETGFSQKKTSIPEKSDIEAKALLLYKALVSSGYLKMGEDISEKQLEVLDAISIILDISFNDPD